MHDISEMCKNLITLTIAAALLAASPAAAKTCVIIYADDMGPKVTAEIRKHEIGHCVCPDWTHPPRKGMFAAGSVPPKQCQGQYKGTLIESPMSTKDAIATCGSLGCADRFD